ncbi:hypothetical protein A2U01_0051835 [Trifolium medium]|uniref:Uncharacterized protein n=1 Tax=Trifolium medium TaxID=97028 RepID=A0A392R3E9_9FABA|nr:hypothetical protein [Trifolium medium]
MTEKTSDSFHIYWRWKLLNNFYLCFVNFNAFGRDFVTKNNAFGHHKVTLLPIKNQISFNTPLQYGVQIFQTKFK